MFKRTRQAVGALAWMMLVANAAYAQGSIVGVVRDTSGAVLPGVTVEAASPALIEKVRSVVTDGTGQYQIVSLAAGTYTVTYTLPGFNTVKRDGIELTGSFTAKVDTEMRVGALEETINVTGEAPIVDVQSAAQERVVNREVIDTIPAGRSALDYVALIPGATASQRDVGGSGAIAHVIRTTLIHGGGTQIILRNGVVATGQATNEQATPMNLNPSAAREVVIDTAAVSAEYAQNGVRVNVIPRDGGNTFSGTVFANYATEALQTDNFSQELKDRGLGKPASIKLSYDIDPGFGGPLKKDKVWFFVSARRYLFQVWAPGGGFFNLNANKPNEWTYAPDVNRRTFNSSLSYDAQLRLSWQVNDKHKIGGTWQESPSYYGPTDIGATVSPEAASYRTWPVQRQGQLEWSSPQTNRLLFEAGGNFYIENSNIKDPPDVSPEMIRVVEQSTGLGYRAPEISRTDPRFSTHLMGAVSYITGTHALKVGFHHTQGYNSFTNFNVAGQPVAYRFNNGVPNQLTQNAFPSSARTELRHNFGVYAQDKWTAQRLTATYGGRFDYIATGWDDEQVLPTLLTPTTSFTIPAASSISWKDVTPHLGAVYDLFGTGRTALKVSLKKGLEGIDSRSDVALNSNPINTLITQQTRSWNDANRNFVPDCDLQNTAANGECGALANQNFGRAVPGATYDTDLMRGWGKRGYNWEFSAGVQHEILPRTAVDAGYFRRSFGNQRVTQNRANPVSAFDFFDITAPVDPRLPGGGGYVIHGLYNLKPAFFGLPADDLVTLAKNIAATHERWEGVDVNINMRPVGGVLLQGGMSTGHTLTDNCDFLAKSPAPPNARNQGVVTPGQITPLDFCHRETPWLTQVKLIGSYTVPKVGIAISGTFQDVPGPAILANYTLPNAVATQALGRPLSGGAANISVPLVNPGVTVYGERSNQVDLRFSKRITMGRTRTTFNLDVYNAFNDSSVITYNNSFAVWQRPTSIMLNRFAKVGFQVDF